MVEFKEIKDIVALVKSDVEYNKKLKDVIAEADPERYSDKIDYEFNDINSLFSDVELFEKMQLEEALNKIKDTLVDVVFYYDSECCVQFFIGDDIIGLISMNGGHIMYLVEGEGYHCVEDIVDNGSEEVNADVVCNHIVSLYEEMITLGRRNK